MNKHMHGQMSPIVNLTPDQVRMLRTSGQFLHTPAGRGSLVEVVRSLCGINAQMTPSMMLSLRARVGGIDLADIKRAIGNIRSLVRTWAMRGTLHLVDSNGIRWFVSILGPFFIAKDRGRRAGLGLTDDMLADALEEIPAVMRDSGPLTRWELMDRLKENRVHINEKSQAPIHLIKYAALNGLLFLGPDRENGESTYVLMDKWLAKSKRASGARGLAALAKRYLGGYGPASIADFAAWSGVTLTDARKAWRLFQDENPLTEGQVEGQRLWLLQSQVEAAVRPVRSRPVVRLLPAFDTYVTGYANRDFVVSRERYREVYHGGQTVPVVLVDGYASGVWRYERERNRLAITVQAFGSFDKTVWNLVSEEAEDIGRFLRDASLFAH